MYQILEKSFDLKMIHWLFDQLSQNPRSAAFWFDRVFDHYTYSGLSGRG